MISILLSYSFKCKAASINWCFAAGGLNLTTDSAQCQVVNWVIIIMRKVLKDKDSRFTIKAFVRISDVDSCVKYCILEYVSFLTATDKETQYILKLNCLVAFGDNSS